VFRPAPTIHLLMVSDGTTPPCFGFGCMADDPLQNALARDMLRKEREAARRKAEYRERETAQWFAPFFAITLAIGLLVIGYTMYRNEHTPTLPIMTGPAQ
jgi:hypothetical protein